MATISAATLVVIYWVVKIFFAVIGGIAGLVVLLAPLTARDQSRHAGGFSKLVAFKSGRLQYPTRKALTFAPKAVEPVTTYDGIVDELQTGDLFMFSGCRWWSWIIRIATWSRMSHAGMIYRRHGAVYVAEVVERFKITRSGWWFRVDTGGFQLRLLSEYIKQHPGQCYVAKVAPIFESTFDRGKVAQAIEQAQREGWSYGWCGIGFQLLIKCPIVCIPVYLWTWRTIDQAWGPSYSPYCSWADDIWAEIGGHDPVPHLAPQLTTPADIERSMLWPELLAVAA